MSLFREAVLGPAFTPGSGSAIPGAYDRPAVSPPKAARRRADRRRQRIPPNGPVVKFICGSREGKARRTSWPKGSTGPCTSSVSMASTWTEQRGRGAA